MPKIMHMPINVCVHTYEAYTNCQTLTGCLMWKGVNNEILRSISEHFTRTFGESNCSITFLLQILL